MTVLSKGDESSPDICLVYNQYHMMERDTKHAEVKVYDGNNASLPSYSRLSNNDCIRQFFQADLTWVFTNLRRVLDYTKSKFPVIGQVDYSLEGASAALFIELAMGGDRH